MDNYMKLIEEEEEDFSCGEWEKLSSNASSDTLLNPLLNPLEGSTM
jgi:hypothetical protein